MLKVSILFAALCQLSGLDIDAVDGSGILFRTPLDAYLKSALKEQDKGSYRFTTKDDKRIPAISMVATGKTLRQVLDKLAALKLIGYRMQDGILTIDIQEWRDELGERLGRPTGFVLVEFEEPVSP